MTTAAAERDGKLTGFLAGEQMMFAPHHFASQFTPPLSIAMPVECHAVAAGEDATEVYRALYAWLSERWVRDGFFAHRVRVVPGDADVQEAWVALGFGRYLTCGVRDTGPVHQAAGGRLEVHRAGTEDLETVLQLGRTLDLFHTAAPMFWPHLPSVQEAVRAFHLEALASGETPYFVAYRDGSPIAMQTFLRPGFAPPIVERLRDVYLYEGVVETAVRSGGVGSALLDHSMAWAREQGFQTCTLHFASGNPSGAPFWLGHGFVPVEHTMERRVDERIAWAGGRD